MKNVKTIKIELGPEDVAQIILEWTGKSVSPAQAVKIFKAIQAKAQDLLHTEAFKIVTELTDQLP